MVAPWSTQRSLVSLRAALYLASEPRKRDRAMTDDDGRVSRRLWLRGAGGVALAFLTTGGVAGAARAALRPVPMTVHKDPNCGCCTAWADRMRAGGHFAPRVAIAEDIAAVKARLRVPPELSSCHTTEVGGYVIEGHVPSADIRRLLAVRPKGMLGLAVPGMPVGSPGMEVPDGTRQPFEVVAFAADGRRYVFARHT